VKTLIHKVFLWLIALSVSVLLLKPAMAYGQKEKKKESDKKTTVRELSPHKATLWAIIPGAGQIYNRKYWKLPIVYAGFAAFGYFGITNRQQFRKYKEAYICSAKADNDDNFTCDNPLAEKYSTADLNSIANYYRRNRDLSFILMGAWYVLQMLDATVDAHLSYWNVDDNLTLKVEPVIQPFNMPNELPAHNGIKLLLNF